MPHSHSLTHTIDAKATYLFSTAPAALTCTLTLALTHSFTPIDAKATYLFSAAAAPLALTPTLTLARTFTL